MFKPDSPFYQFISRFIDVVKLNFMWFLFSLPIVTIGASSLAVYSVTMKMAEDKEGYMVSGFIKAFKENLRQGIPMGLMNLGAVLIVYINIALFYKIESNPIGLLIVGIAAGIYFFFSFLYAYPLLARYENTIRNSLNNSLKISARYFGSTILLVVIIALISVIAIYNYTTIFFAILIGPAYIMFTISSFALRIFRQIEKEDE